MQFYATKTSDKLSVNIDHVYCTDTYIVLVDFNLDLPLESDVKFVYKLDIVQCTITKILYKL